jgi:uncharacterized membrane protein
MRFTQIQSVAVSAVMAALYAALTIVLAPISFGLVQLRIADALLPLPYVLGWPMAIGLFLGCAVANVFGGLGAVDILFGSFFNLLAGLLVSNRKTCPHWILAWLYPTLIIGLGVPAYLTVLFYQPYIVGVVTIMTSTGIVTSVGILVLFAVDRAFPALPAKRTQKTGTLLNTDTHA